MPKVAATFDSQNVWHFPISRPVFRAGVGVSSWKKKTRHEVLIMFMCTLTATTTCYYLILNPSLRTSGQPATSNAMGALCSWTVNFSP
ncbi:hypothetical protein AU210_016517 [Fusarium oxysporum f. sp. radicis-cucumerinum]|uniref:Uncharacterized protein n=1 Tax=Fusarium oxysporum f. sp. radicis-cucumerinum TaxID=327505 RepID=A0A2H3FMU6_FUSOX|nr:hypothetical protein AU210_016517 [Fusarium oxysporum f. sp. radicis-cucumerinum]